MFVFIIFFIDFKRYGRIAEMTDKLQRIARVLGHMCNLFAALLLFPVTRNSIWVEIIGIPYERAVKYPLSFNFYIYIYINIHIYLYLFDEILDITDGQD